MKSMSTGLFLTRALLIFSSCAAAPVFSQDPAAAYPAKPVFLISPYAPGGGTDRDGVPLVQKLSEYFGKPFLLDYKPGAGSVLGTQYVAKAAPDGHTLVIITAAFTVLGAAKPDLPYDTLRDFAPISLRLKRQTMLVVHASTPVSNFAEYVAYAKANPDKLNFGTTGEGSLYHIYGAWLHGATHTKVTYVPYKGTGPLSVDLVAGRVDAAPISFLTGMRWVKAGKLRVLGMMGTERSTLFPDVKTIAEQGVADYDSSAWNGILAPAGTPEAILNKVSAGINRWARDPATIKQMVTDTGDGTILIGSTPAVLKAHIGDEINRWRRLVREHGIKVE